MTISTSEVLSNLIELITNYNQISRSTTNPFILQKVKTNFPEWQYDPQNSLIRETVAEHVGNLPIIATFLFPYLEHKIDIGKVLTMLAIHDIAETVNGDINTFAKKQTDRDMERQNALKLIPKSLIPIFEEYDALESSEAKFARSLDKIAPEFLGLICPKEITIERFKVQLNKNQEEILPLIQKHQTTYMQWDNFLSQFHAEVLQQLEKKLNN